VEGDVLIGIRAEPAAGTAVAAPFAGFAELFPGRGYTVPELTNPRLAPL
jgi:hypothetical protein